jgi:tight adherence protein B
MTGGVLIFLALLGTAVFLLSYAMVVPAFGSDARMRKLLKHRLRDIGALESKGEVASLLRQKYLRDLSPLERRLEELPLMERLSLVIEQSGRTVLAHRVVGLALVLAVAGFLVVLLVGGNALLALAGAVLAGAAPFLVIFRDRRRRLEKFEEQLPDAMDVMTRALRAGHPFNSCLKLVAEDMQPPISREFVRRCSECCSGYPVET